MSGLQHPGGGKLDKGKRREYHPGMIGNDLLKKIILFAAILPACAWFSSCSGKKEFDDPSFVKVLVKEVMVDSESNSPVIRLESVDGAEYLIIWIGVNEAAEIAFPLEGKSSPRPLTHDLMKNIFEILHVSLEKVLITELKDNTYFARLYIRKGGMSINMDARPSDALAMAVRYGCPVYVLKDLMLNSNPASVRRSGEAFIWDDFGFSIQNMSPQIRDYFGFGDLKGVLVSDIDDEGGSYLTGLRRGDVIIKVDGEQVGSVSEFIDRINRLDDETLARLTVLRNRELIEIVIHSMVEE